LDYAHTPDALETVLNAVRAHQPNSISLVFGCGGDRDAGKRPLMGEVAQRLAGTIFITDDNPRSENPAEIRRQILKTCPDATEIGDRADAIMRAVQTLNQGDVLIIAGKGHEQGQIIGDRTLPFSDTDVARAAIRQGG